MYHEDTCMYNTLILVINFPLLILFYVCHNNPRIHSDNLSVYFHDHCLSFVMCNNLDIFVMSRKVSFIKPILLEHLI